MAASVLRLAARGRYFLGAAWLRSTEAKPEKEGGEGNESADGIQQGIVGRGAAAGDESLMNFIEAGVRSGGEPCEKCPSPAPAGAIAAETPEEQEAKNKIFSEMRALADEMVDEVELMRVEMREQPVDEGQEHGRGVVRGEIVGREREDEASPEESRPPGAQPAGNQ